MDFKKIIQDVATKVISNDQKVPQESEKPVVSNMVESVLGSLKGGANPSDLEGILGGESNQLMDMIKSQFKSLADKDDKIDSEVAEQSSSLIPNVMKQVGDFVKGDDGKFDMSDIMRMVSQLGGGGSGMLGGLKGLFK